MGVLGAVARTTQTYPALLPLALAAVAAALWYWRSNRRIWAATSMVVGGLVCLLYMSGAPAQAFARLSVGGGSSPAGLALPDAAAPAGAGGSGARSDRGRNTLRTGTASAPLDRLRFSSTTRYHPRFPADFPIPRVFRLESNFGGTRNGTVTARLRFGGQGKDAVRDLKESAAGSGWEIEVLAPHRMVFRKDERTIEAWFSYPGHSVVLDVPDPR
jgi:hypothetical protein